MLKRREIVFEQEENKKLNINNGSLFHGFLMENLSPNLTDYLHSQSLRPFSQFLSYSKGDNKWVWNIATLDKEVDIEIEKLFSNTNTIKIKKKDMVLKIDYIKSYPSLTYKDLTKDVYSEGGSRNINVSFLTPCSFKISGNNVILPQVSYLYQNILNKWNAFAKEVSIDDRDAIQHINNYTYISDFNIRASNYSLESATKKGFIGKIQFRVRGPEPLVNLCNLMFRFSEYSGIGSSTALGMGGVRIEFR